MLDVGDTAPDFTIPDQDGQDVSLSDLRGRPVVLYFYPRADTPGCTTQACGVRDHAADYDAAGATVVGVSPDPQSAVSSFAEKFSLRFPLLADADHAVAYGLRHLGREAAVRKRPTGRPARRPSCHRPRRRIAHVIPEGLAEDPRRRGPAAALGGWQRSRREGDPEDRVDGEAAARPRTSSTRPRRDVVRDQDREQHRRRARSR